MEAMRAALRGMLPPEASLKRDRGDALLISNAPALDPAPREYPGFLAERQGGWIRFLPGPAWIARCEEPLPEASDFLGRSLLRFRGMVPDLDNLRLFARGAKLCDGGAAPGAIEAYDRALRQRAALALRGGCGGGLYACALLNARLHSDPKPKEQ